MVAKTGELLPKLVDSQTGRIIEIAKAVPGNPLNPVIVLLDGVQMVQTHLGFQKTYRMIEALQQSLGVLQTTTAIVGVGVAVTGVLTAVNLYQTLQLRKDVQQMRKDLTNGFLDLKQVLTEQHTEILERIDQKAFEERRRELERAYARFTEATRLVGFALELQNSNAKDNYLANAAQTMSESLAIYNDPQLLPGMNAAGKLRRCKCAWTIEQAIALIFQLQNESIAASKCLGDLQHKIRQDALYVANACESQAELDFIFPELTRIQSQDLPALEAWQTRIEVLHALPPSESEKLPNLSDQSIKTIETEVVPTLEEKAYEKLQASSSFYALKDQLRFMIKPELRKEYEAAIEQRALKAGYSALVPTDWQDISDSTIANLFWYLNQSPKSTEA